MLILIYDKKTSLVNGGTKIKGYLEFNSFLYHSKSVLLLLILEFNSSDSIKNVICSLLKKLLFSFLVPSILTFNFFFFFQIPLILFLVVYLF